MYVKDCVNFDIIRIDETLEYSWAEVQGKNKRSPYLTGIVYQSGSKNGKKIEWMKKQAQRYLS